VHGRVGIGESIPMSVVGRLEFVAKDANVRLAFLAEVARLSALVVDGLSIKATANRWTTLPMDVSPVGSARSA
jgi:hypothetical protein